VTQAREKVSENEKGKGILPRAVPISKPRIPGISTMIQQGVRTIPIINNRQMVNRQAKTFPPKHILPFQPYQYKRQIPPLKVPIPTDVLEKLQERKLQRLQQETQQGLLDALDRPELKPSPLPQPVEFIPAPGETRVVIPSTMEENTQELQFSSPIQQTEQTPQTFPPLKTKIQPRKALDLGRLANLLVDEHVKALKYEDGKLIKVTTRGEKKTEIQIDDTEARKIIQDFSESTGTEIKPVFEAVYDNLKIFALLSDIVGPNFLIRKMKERELSEIKKLRQQETSPQVEERL